jgi:hypothetical protein
MANPTRRLRDFKRYPSASFGLKPLLLSDINLRRIIWSEHLKEPEMSTTPDSNIKARVSEALESLPDDATWDDVMYRLYVRQKIEAGLKDVEEGNTLSNDEVRKRFGLPE